MSAPNTEPAVVQIATEGGQTLEADLWDCGGPSLILAHPLGRSRKMWNGHADAIAEAGITVLAPDFQGHGSSTGAGTPAAMIADIGACETFLRERGAKSVSLLGAGTGGSAAISAVLKTVARDIDLLLLIGPLLVDGPIGLAHNRIFWATADEDRGTGRAIHQRMLAPDSIELTIYTGDYPGEDLFESPHRDALLERIIQLIAPTS